MKEKIVIIGANDFQNRLILKAKEMGYETHVFAWQSGDIGEKTADFFYPISITEKEQILEECKKIKPKGICSIASDLAVVTVNYVAENLGLTGNGTNTTLGCTNKYEMRKKMKDAGVRVPGFVKVKENDEEPNLEEMRFPMIVKPTDRSGSRGITKIFKKEELKNAIQVSAKQSFDKEAIIEEYIEGNEYSCECISYKGTHYFLAFTKKFTTGSPNFIETGHVQPSDIPEEYQEKIIQEIFKALDALEIKNGASHTEFKLDKEGNCRIIEIGARMGGDCIGSDLVQISTGYDFVKMVIDVACGKKPELEKKNEGQAVEIRFLFNEKDLQELEEYKQKYPKKIYRISQIEIENLGKTVDSSTRIGYYIFLK